MRNTILASLFLVVFPALATVVIHETLEEMSANSQLALRGTVLESEARYGPNGRSINTYTQLRVDEVLKGNFGGAPTVTVRQPGGTVGDLTMEVPGTAKFTKGEEVVVFLEPVRDEPGMYITRALGAAKFSLPADPNKPVSQDLMGISFARSGGQRLTDGSGQQRATLNRDQFLSQVRRAVESSTKKN